jgi:hypothetical protein
MYLITCSLSVYSAVLFSPSGNSITRQSSEGRSSLKRKPWNRSSKYLMICSWIMYVKKLRTKFWRTRPFHDYLWIITFEEYGMIPLVLLVGDDTPLAVLRIRGERFLITLISLNCVVRYYFHNVRDKNANSLYKHRINYPWLVSISQTTISYYITVPARVWGYSTFSICDISSITVYQLWLLLQVTVSFLFWIAVRW